MSNTETVKAIYEAFGRGDIPFILSQLSDSIEWDNWTTESYAQKADIPWLKHRTGKDGVAEFFKVVAEMGIYRFDVLSLMEGGNQVVSELSMGCKYYVDESLHLWTFDEEGKVKRFRHYVDTAKHIAGYESAEKSAAA
jgi:ketosteroid isomerase-like protein